MQYLCFGCQQMLGAEHFKTNKAGDVRKICQVCYYAQFRRADARRKEQSAKRARKKAKMLRLRRERDQRSRPC